MPDGDHKRRRILARVHPVGTIFLIWLVLDQISSRARDVAPDVIGTAAFQHGAVLILGLVLALGWLVAFRRALRATGRARLFNAGLALVFAAICCRRVVLTMRVADSCSQVVAVGRMSAPGEEAQLAKMLDRAFTGHRADARLAIALVAYRLHGYRIVYKDEAGIPRLYEPPADDVAKYEQHRRLDESMRSFLASTAEQADHAFWAAYAYLLGIGVMLVGSLVLIIRRQPKPEPPIGEQPQYSDAEQPATRSDRDPVTEALMHDADITLLQRNLKLTPQQRIDQLVEMQKFAAELRAAGRVARERED